jgi:DNA-binding LacI/PurR family transcriptional regulator
MAGGVMAKFTKVFEALERAILEGKFAHGKRLPSESELCQRFKVSRPTAARALRELQQMGVITRRAGSGSYLTPPHAVAPSASRTLGLFVPGLGNTEILSPICNEITRYAQSLGCSVRWGDAGTPITSSDEALRLCQQYIEHPVDGIFFAPIESIPGREVWNRRIADAFMQKGIPIVLLDRDLGEFPSQSEFDLVGIDNVVAAIALTRHLLEQGRERICFTARPHYPSTTNLRLIGCREAMRMHGLRPAYRLSHYGDPTDPEFVKGMLELASPDAIICSNDQTAALLMRTLTQLHCSVPEQIAVAGLDDVEYASLLSPALTTIRQPCSEIARTAVRTLIERINNPGLPPRHIHHCAQLVVRQSSGAHLTPVA